MSLSFGTAELPRAGPPATRVALPCHSWRTETNPASSPLTRYLGTLPTYQLLAADLSTTLSQPVAWSLVAEPGDQNVSERLNSPNIRTQPIRYSGDLKVWGGQPLRKTHGRWVARGCGWEMLGLQEDEGGGWPWAGDRVAQDMTGV